MELEKIIKEIAETIQSQANVKAVFGEPVKLDNHVVIPVAKISVAFGLGGGSEGQGAERREEGNKAGEERGFGGAGGMKLQALPAGFIHEKDGEVVFSTIDVPQEGLLSDLTSLLTNPLMTKIFSIFTPKRESEGKEKLPQEY
jgi:uncharacterized spore protein YtfJ